LFRYLLTLATFALALADVRSDQPPEDGSVSRPVRTLGTGIVYCTLISPDEQSFLTAGSRGAFLWDLATEALLRSFTVPDPASGIRSVVFTEDGQRLITGGADGVMRVWDVNSGAC
jgi:eukaryotic-like serine/threonine-protein kinase